MQTIIKHINTEYVRINYNWSLKEKAPEGAFSIFESNNGLNERVYEDPTNPRRFL
ncbi:hypothetical protein ACSO1_06340 [Acinetobacter calcoaceticus]|nr:hypothetical protein ACSO1_06340 [Acinetobacter calcoaceticus]